MKSISLICRDLVPYENVLKLKPKWKHFWKWIWAKQNCIKLLLPEWITVESFYRLCQSFGEILYGLLCDPNIHIFAPTFFSLAMMMTREMNKCVHFLPHLRFVAANTICLLMCSTNFLWCSTYNINTGAFTIYVYKFSHIFDQPPTIVCNFYALNVYKFSRFLTQHCKRKLWMPPKQITY